MKMQGMVIESPEEDEFGDDFENELDNYNERIYNFTEKLEQVTDQFSCGQDDGKDFFASDNKDVLRMLKEEFPDNSIEELNMEDWPWDKCHVEDQLD